MSKQCEYCKGFETRAECERSRSDFLVEILKNIQLVVAAAIEANDTCQKLIGGDGSDRPKGEIKRGDHE